MDTFTIYLTNKCNMNCRYCYEQKGSYKEHSWVKVKNTIDNYIKHNKKFNIEFIGGEPLLRFDLLKKAYNYLESQNRASINSYFITTNGTIISDSIVDFIKNNSKIKLGISLDGNKIMNSYRTYKNNQKNVYSDVISNIKTLYKHIDKGRILIHMVIHPHNVGYLKDGVIELYKMGINRLEIGIVESTWEMDNYSKGILKQEVIKIARHIKDNNIQNLLIYPLMANNYTNNSKEYIKDSDGVILGEKLTKELSDNSLSNTTDIKEEIYNLFQKEMGSDK